jgi:transposase
MLSFPGSLKVFVAVAACDMRKGFNGLHALVTERLGEDLKSGALFVFSNRRHTRIKIIYFDGTGIWVLSNKHVPHCSLRFVKLLYPFHPLFGTPLEAFGAA